MGMGRRVQVGVGGRVQVGDISDSINMLYGLEVMVPHLAHW